MVAIRRQHDGGPTPWKVYLLIAVSAALILFACVALLPSLEATGSLRYLSQLGSPAGEKGQESSSPQTNDASNPSSSSSSSSQREFYPIALGTGTDKVQGTTHFPACRDEGKQCTYDERKNPKCKVYGHFYDSVYQRWLGSMSTDDAEPFQFLEIGFYNGKGFEAYTKFLPRAELHSMEIACLPPGPQEEGKWPWGNFAEKHPWYGRLLEEERLHCGDASAFAFLNRIWTTKMRRDGAPPLKVVVDDGSHEAPHMVATIFFWLPRVQPGGMVVVEDIEPTQVANPFRTEFLPQIMRDLHYCGDPKGVRDDVRFPTLQPMLKSIYCEMHICVFQRNEAEAKELGEEESTPPSWALDPSKFQGAGK